MGEIYIIIQEAMTISMAMTQNFARIATEDTESDYLEFKQFEEEKTIKAEEIEKFNYTLFRGYHWYTLACRTHGIYDLYRIYDKWHLIAETEDPVIELPVEPKDIVVKAYDKYGEGKLIQLGQSKSEIGLPLREHSHRYTLSVIVPLYNSELFMCRTIDSIMSNSLSDIELILINDGSTDKSLEIAKRYADNYSCVTVVDQENKWVAVTRNRWLDMARWEYVAFCDNDDIPHPLMYERLLNTCKEQGTDIAIAQTLIRTHPWMKEWYLSCSANKEDVVVYDFDEMLEKRSTKANIFFVAVWNKIVKTDVARQARFPEWYGWPWVLYEDVAYTWSLYSYIDRFAYCRDAIYTWDKRKQQTVWTASTWHKACDNEYVWKMFIYGFSWMLYHKSWKHLERHDYSHFKRLIESYKKFNTPSPMRTYRDMKLAQLVRSQKLYDNKLIMNDEELKQIVSRFI